MICAERAYLLNSEDGKKMQRTEIEYLHSAQEEINTRVILYCFFAKEQGYKFIRVKSPDTDLFFICLYFANILEGIEIIFDMGRGNKKNKSSMSRK